MAEDKKSFVLYADLIHTIRKMPKDKAGELFLHILEYVNDLNPETDDLIIQLTFEPIKQQLKRDLIKWDQEKIQRSEAGKKGMESRWGNKNIDIQQNKEITNDNGVITNHNTVIDDITKITDNVNVSVNDNVNDTIIKKKIKEKPEWYNDFEIYKQSCRDGFEEIKKDIEWIRLQESYYNEIDVIKSVEKNFVNYWSTENGWQNKKKSGSMKLNWKTTMGNSIKYKENRVYKQNKN